VACTQEGTRYTTRELTLARDAAGALTMTYALERPDPDDAHKKCVVRTAARLVRAARESGCRAAEGRWEASTLVDGKAGRTTLEIAAGRCTREVGGHRIAGRCTRDGATLTVADDAGPKDGRCPARQTGRYAVTFTEDCSGFELEALTDPCGARQDALEYLIFRPQR
jgi:hypothetical protein